MLDYLLYMRPLAIFCLLYNYINTTIQLNVYIMSEPYYAYYSASQTTHQYYTLALVNPPSADNTDQFPVRYDETRNNTYLSNPQDYYCSVVRFSVTTPQLPIIIPAIKDYSTGQTEYSITMRHPDLNTGAAFRQYVFYVPQSPLITPPGKKNDTSEYYYVYQPAQFIAMVNTAFAACWEGVIGSAGTPWSNNKGNSPWIDWPESTTTGTLYGVDSLTTTPKTGATYPPTFYPTGTPYVGTSAVANSTAGTMVLTFSPATLIVAKFEVGDYIKVTGLTPAAYSSTFKIIAVDINPLVNSITVQVPTGLGAVSGTPTIQANMPMRIYMNASLWNLFSSFTFQNNASTLAPSPGAGRHWELQMNNSYASERYFGTTYAAGTGSTPEVNVRPQFGTVAPTTSALYNYVVQQYSTLPLWNPVCAIVFTTAVLPINPEDLSLPNVPGTGSTLSSQGNNSAIGTVLTDFEIPYDSGLESKPLISYSPIAEYRLTDLMSNMNLNTIQLTIGWRTKFGVFIPLNIGVNGYAQLKLMFRRRDFNGT